MLVLLLALQAAAPSPPDVVRQARAAVAAGRAAEVRDSLTRVLHAAPDDRAATLGLATLARLTYDFAGADRRIAALLADPDTLDPWSVQALVGLGFMTLGREPFDSTRALMDAASRRARAVGDAAALAEALTLRGFVASRRETTAEALALLDRAVRAVPAGHPPLLAFVLCYRAPILSFGGDRRAGAEVQRGLALARQGGVPWVLGLCYQSALTIAINASGDPAVIEALADSAEAAQRAAGDRFGRSVTLFIRGYARLARYDIAGARRSLLEALVEGAASGSLFTLAWTHRFLGEMHWLTSDVGAADREFRVAVEAFDRLGDGFGRGSVERTMAFVALDLGRVDEAETVFRRGLARSQAAGIAEEVQEARLALAAVRLVRGEYAAARREAEAADAYGRTTGHAGWSGALQYHLGLASLRLGDLDRAERHLRAAAAVAGDERSLERYAARSRLAELHVRRGDHGRALAELRAATDQLDSLRAAIDDRQLRLLVFQTRREWDEPDLGFATIVAALVRAGYPADAFDLAERRRARLLADRLLRSQVVDGDSGHLALSRMAPRAGTARALPAGSALLEYVGGERGQPTTLFVVAGGEVRGLVAPPLDDLRDDLRRFAITLRAGGRPDSLGARLRQALLDPALALLPDGVSRLVIVPDGELHRLPFEALPLPGGDYLLARYAVSFAPSATAAAALARRPAPSGPAGVLAIGDPAFAAGGFANPYRAAYEESGGLPRLPASAGEARRVARFGDAGEIRLGERASEAWLKRTRLDGYRVIHFATHAMADEQGVARTSLALAPGDGEDGFLSPGELAGLRLAADLVVLASCRTASGLVVGGEGVQGLTSALLEAGARSVVAARWPVGDRATAGLFADFYRHLADGHPADEALRRTKLAAARRGEPAASWLAFVVVGDPGVALALRRPGRVWWWWVAGALALAGVAGWAVRRRRA